MAFAEALGTVIIKFLAESAQFDNTMTKMSTGLDKVGKTLTNIGNGLSSFGNKMGLAAAALSTPFIKGLSDLREFDKQFTQVLTLFGKNPPPDNVIEQMRSGVKQLAVDMGVDLMDAVDALYFAISSGVSPENSISFLTESTKAAKAGATDLHTAVDVLTSVINAYGAEAYTAQEASDILFEAVNFGKTTFEELGATIGQVIPVAAQFKVPLEEVGALLGVLTRQGISTDIAITGLRQAIVQIISPTDQVREQAAGLGIDLSAAGIKANGLVGTFKKLMEAAKENDQVFSDLLPEVRALMTATAAAADSGELMDEAMRRMTEAGGNTERGFEKMKQTLDHTVEVLKSKFSVAMLELAEAVLPKVTAMMESVLTKLDSFTKWAKENPEEFDKWANAVFKLIVAMAELAIVAKVLGWIAVVLGSISTATGKTTTAFKWLRDILMANKGVLVGIALYLKDFWKALVTPTSVTGALRGLLGILRTIAGVVGGELAKGLAAFLNSGVAFSGISGPATLAAGSVTALGSAVALTGYGIYVLRDAANTWNTSAERGVAVADRAIKSFNLQSDSLKQLKTQIDATTDAEEKRLLQENYLEKALGQANSVIEASGKLREDQVRKAIASNKDWVLSSEQVNAAWFIMQSTGVDAVTAVAYAQQNLATVMEETGKTGADAASETAERFTEMFEKMSEDEKKALDNTIKIQKERSNYRHMDANEQQKYFESILTMSNYAFASEAERAEVLMQYKQNEITMEQAVIVAKENFTAQEIALLEKGANAADLVAKRKQMNNEDDTRALAEKLAKDSANIDNFAKSVDSRIAELITKRDELRQRAREIIHEDGAQAFQLMEDARAISVQIGQLAMQKQEIVVGAHEVLMETLAKEAGLTWERAKEELEAGELEKKALAERKERLGENFDAVINSLGQYKSIYQSMTDEQKAVVDNFVVNMLDSNLAINSTAEGTKTALANTTEGARALINQFVTGTQNAGAQFKLTMDNQAKTAGEVMPQVKASIDVVSGALQQNRAEYASTNQELNTQNQLLDNMTRAGTFSVQAMEEQRAKSEELQGKLSTLSGEFDVLSAAQRGNRSELIATREKLVEQITSTEQLIMKKRSEGETTADLDRKLTVLNATYNVVSFSMKQLGLEVPPLKEGLQQTGTAAGETGTKMSDAAAKTNELGTAVSTTSTKLQTELPNAARTGMAQTEGIIETTINNIKATLWSLWEDIKYVLDFSQTGSPSMNQYIEGGLRQTESIYGTHISNIQGMLRNARDAQVEMFSAGMGTGMGGSSSKSAPPKNNKRRITDTTTQNGWVQLPDGTWVFVQGYESTTRIEDIPNPQKPPAKKKSISLSGGFSRDDLANTPGLERLAEVFERIEERLARLRDPERYKRDMAEAMEQASDIPPAPNTGEAGARAGRLGAPPQNPLPTQTQDSLATKIGVAVAREMVKAGGLGGKDISIYGLPPHIEPIIKAATSAAVSRIEEDRYKNRRRYS